MKRLLPDRITLGLLLALFLSIILPCTGESYRVFDTLTDLAVALLFFLHGAKLSRRSIIEGLTHWKLHLVILGLTFVLFPIIGLLLKPLLVPLFGEPLYWGFLFLCFAPSTVQSSIAFTSIARGNIAAAVCAASMSSLLGIIITPLLFGIFILAQEGSVIAWDSVLKITLLLLLPFAIGQLLRPRIGAWIEHHKPVVGYVDQTSILLIVYTAFSKAMNDGLWRDFSPGLILALLALLGALLLGILLLSFYGSKKLGFSLPDRITIMFCGSKKSLASGAPMLKLLAVGQMLGPLILPLMLYHQLQLIACALIARHLSQRKEP